MLTESRNLGSDFLVIVNVFICDKNICSNRFSLSVKICVFENLNVYCYKIIETDRFSLSVKICAYEQNLKPEM